MLWVTDAAGAITFLKSEWEAVTGQPVAAAHGAGWIDKIHKDDRSRVTHAFEQAASRKEQFIVRFRIASKSEDYGWFESSATPSIVPSSGAFIGYYGTLEPIVDDYFLSEAEVEIGALRPPSEVLDGALPSLIEGLADQVIYARQLADSAQETAIREILDVALLEIGRRLAILKRKPPRCPNPRARN